MQLFTLINTLLNHNSESFGRNLYLQPYEVIPLSPSAGLLSWVPNTQQYVISDKLEYVFKADIAGCRVWCKLIETRPEAKDSATRSWLRC